MSDKLTITLTDRPPVRVTKDDWPIFARAADSDHDGEDVEQANRRWSWVLQVRRHPDGRAIVYGVYAFVSQWQHERNANVRGGELLDAGADLPAAIRRVGEWMAARTDSVAWEALINECIADLPAEDL